MGGAFCIIPIVKVFVYIARNAIYKWFGNIPVLFSQQQCESYIMYLPAVIDTWLEALVDNITPPLTLLVVVGFDCNM